MKGLLTSDGTELAHLYRLNKGTVPRTDPALLPALVKCVARIARGPLLAARGERRRRMRQVHLKTFRARRGIRPATGPSCLAAEGREM